MPASYTGLLYDSPTDEIAHLAEGQVCPDRAGGSFTGRSDIGSGTGRFQEVSGGRGRVLVTMPANGSVTVTLAGHLRTR